MPNVILQDLNAIIHGTSREGLEYDVAHVSILMKTDVPLSPEEQWLIPHVENIPIKALDLIKTGKFALYPIQRSTLISGASNIVQETEQGNTEKVVEDAEKLILASSMKPTTLEPLEGQPNKYIISYKYRLYPVEPNNFEFKVFLPFDGLALFPQGGRLQITLVAPIGAKINPTITKGENQNGQEVATETITPITNTSKNIVSFEIQQDPIFTIRYNY